MTLQIVRDWVLKFNARGPSGLIAGKGLERPAYKKRPPTPSVIDRFEPYLRERRLVDLEAKGEP